MSDTTAATQHAEHAAHPHVNYTKIFVALCVCTALSWVADEAGGWGLIDSKRMIAVIVLAIAVAKAQYVMRYFMHLKFEGKWKYVLLLPTTILACGIPLALAPDIGLHYYRPTTPQTRVEIAPPTELSPTAAPHESAKGSAPEHGGDH
ncbi:MAG: oxidase [Planctomycetota bacterium]|nr:MAG: oxidase [Planctomycetota bacterium]REJ91874.1 MAG: oxidase [Planctomycetota bacterium]REK22550.1 MAG: oxidase [Planctomycetota bacterium]REK36028.1 MAG: oxidase [Planctomycetota bacterium]